MGNKNGSARAEASCREMSCVFHDRVIGIACGNPHEVSAADAEKIQTSASSENARFARTASVSSREQKAEEGGSRRTCPNAVSPEKSFNFRRLLPFPTCDAPPVKNLRINQPTKPKGRVSRLFPLPPPTQPSLRRRRSSLLHPGSTAILGSSPLSFGGQIGCVASTAGGIASRDRFPARSDLVGRKRRGL